MTIQRYADILKETESAAKRRKGLKNIKQTDAKSHKFLRLLGMIGVLFLLLKGLNFFYQTLWAHRYPDFRPMDSPFELVSILEQDVRSKEEYDLIFTQTGLSQWAVETLLQRQDGIQIILETQKAILSPARTVCTPLISGRFTCEDLLQDEEGNPLYSAPLAPFQPGDFLVSFSTHTWGWRHGHAGLLVDPENKTVLEAAQLGVNSYLSPAQNWRNYSNFMILRVKNQSSAQRQQVVEFALKHLNDVPYSLLAGIWGPKNQAGAETYKVQCAYLPWLAWQSVGVDLDGDGGKIVTVRDLVESDAVEVVQVCGIDPAFLLDRQARSP